jgi:hypothetical protein
MSEKILGGHAIMLAVRIPVELARVAQAWVEERPDVRKLKINPILKETGEVSEAGIKKGRYTGEFLGHVTLCFVGRDKPAEVGEKMLSLAKAIAAEYAGEWMSQPYVFEYEAFGFKKDHLAVTMDYEHDCPMKAIAQAAVIGMRVLGINIKKDFDWNPHVTLATGESGFDLPLWRGEHSGLMLEVEGLEVKIGSNRTEFIPL